MMIHFIYPEDSNREDDILDMSDPKKYTPFKGNEMLRVGDNIQQNGEKYIIDEMRISMIDRRVLVFLRKDS